MPRIMYVTTVGWLVAATMHVTAQQPGRAASAVPRSTVARATPAQIVAPRVLPGTRPNVFSAIQGNALTSTNGALTNAIVRLRDARVGQIVGTQMTDESGIFAFRTVDPGSYVVEIMGQDHYSVLAASQILNVGPGEAVSAVVKLPFKVPPFTGALGNSKSSAAALTTEAASAGVLGTHVSGTETCITLQP